MNRPSSLPDHLDESQRSSINNLFLEVELLPISALFYEADEHKVISRNRTIPDDFIYILKKGKLVCHLENETKEIGPGEFMMIEAGKKHGVTMANNIKNYEVFALHMHAIDSIGERFFKRLSSPFGRLSNNKMWFDKLATLVHLMGKSDALSIEFFNQNVKWLLYEQFMQGIQFKELPQRIDIRIAHLLGEFRTDCSKEWTVMSMANDCHLSVSRFRELFVQSTGTSPKKYIQKTRLSQARSLLATNVSLSVEEIAHKVGISDAHYFHAIYKEMFGETPKKSGLLEKNTPY